jgi:hypothetical protein
MRRAIKELDGADLRGNRITLREVSIHLTIIIISVYTSVNQYFVYNISYK